MKDNKWFSGKVIHGAKIGRVVGFPTVNLTLDYFDLTIKRGVHAAKVKYKNKIYKGVLFFGPKHIKKETHDSLEIHILNFNQDVYGETIEFELLDYIRGVGKYKNLEELKRQIEKDVKFANQSEVV